MSAGYRAPPRVAPAPPIIIPLRTKRALYFIVAAVISPMAILFVLGFLGGLARPSGRLVPFGLGALVGVLGVGLTLRSGLKVPTRILVFQGNGRLAIACGDRTMDVAPSQVRDVFVAPRGFDGFRPRVPLQTLVAIMTDGSEIDLLPKIAAMPADLMPARDSLAALLRGGGLRPWPDERGTR